MFSILMILSLFIKKKFFEMQIDKNILSENLSPYLRQHKDNPVHWQIWSKEILNLQNKTKNLFY